MSVIYVIKDQSDIIALQYMYGVSICRIYQDNSHGSTYFYERKKVKEINMHFVRNCMFKFNLMMRCLMYICFSSFFVKSLIRV